MFSKSNLPYCKINISDKYLVECWEMRSDHAANACIKSLSLQKPKEYMMEHLFPMDYERNYCAIHKLIRDEILETVGTEVVSVGFYARCSVCK